MNIVGRYIQLVPKPKYKRVIKYLHISRLNIKAMSDIVYIGGQAWD
jgi:hypothetical protein